MMQIRRILTFFEEVRIDAGRPVSPRLRKAAAVAIVGNPFAGRFEQDLSALTAASEAIGREISDIAVRLLQGDPPVSYGKAAVVGVDGEQEHGNAMLTTVLATSCVRRPAAARLGFPR